MSIMSVSENPRAHRLGSESEQGHLLIVAVEAVMVLTLTRKEAPMDTHLGIRSLIAAFVGFVKDFVVHLLLVLGIATLSSVPLSALGYSVRFLFFES